MSIVERAIKKLQSQPATAVPAEEATAPPRRTNIDTSVHRIPPLAESGSVTSSRPSAEPARAAAVSPAPPVTPLAVPSRSIALERQTLRSCGLLPPGHQERQIQNQYRQIKRPLIANATGKGAEAAELDHLIMIASAVPGEGKTFTSINLALSMAVEKDISVLLVDADVAKPHISSVLGLQSEAGLLDALQDESLDVESLIVGTDVEGLCVLPAGRRTEMATELLASARMEEVMAQLARGDGTRIVLFDSPPLLLTSESRVLSMVVGQIVLVVRAGFTPQQAVLDAISHLPEGKYKGIVLNQCEIEQDSPYYYGYGAYGSPIPADGGRAANQKE